MITIIGSSVVFVTACALVIRRRVKRYHERMLSVPFSEVSTCGAFWFRGKVYIKEDEDTIFENCPMPRFFPLNERVEVDR